MFDTVVQGHKLEYTPAIAVEAAPLYDKVKRVVNTLDWATFAPYILEINRLKKQKGAVILAHNYMTPEIYNCVADFAGDSLQLAQQAAKTEAKIIIQAGVHFMAETSKILSPEKTVLIPDLRAGCSLAASITGADVRLLREKYPNVPIITYVNTSAEVKAESDICCTSSNALAIVESLPGDTVLMIPDQYLARNTAKLTKKKILTWQGSCEVHERFTAEEIKKFRKAYPGVVILAHPECPPEVVAEADFAGSTKAMSDYVRDKQPKKVVMVTECSMSDNVSVSNPNVEFVRPCNLCPHMKRISLQNILTCLQTMSHEVTVDPVIAARAKLAVERMLAVRCNMKPEIIDTADIVIVGAGAAGLFTALSLAPKRVIVLSEKPLGGICASCWAQGGIAAAVDKEDSSASHAADTLKAAAGTADAEVVRILTAEAPATINVLETLGVQFEHDKDGGFKLSREACHARRRVLKAAAGDGFGHELMRALVEAVKKTPSIVFVEEVAAERIIRRDGPNNGPVQGILGRQLKDGQPVVFAAPAVVLATGGIGGLYASTTNPLGAVGRGIAMAARAGALLSDLEFVQFHPTALDIGEDPAPLATEALRGEGAHLLNSRGERFMLKYHEMAELAPRDIVSRGIFAQMQKGQKIYLDCRHIDVTHFPALLQACARANINPQRDLVPVMPAAHYHMGGIATDLHGRTSLNGLWACGETGATGLHGANRLASNSLMEAVVMGGRVASDVLKSKELFADTIHINTESLPILPQKCNREAEKDALRHIMMDKIGVIRDKQTMTSAIHAIAAIARDAEKDDSRLADMALVARMIAVSALQRTESRGGHCRSDYPEAVKSWKKRSFTTLKEIDALTDTLLRPSHTQKAGAGTREKASAA